MTVYDFDDIERRVTIRDILKASGIRARTHRIACPIHRGKNPTSFCFTRSVFYCFSCGAQGGLLDLAEYLFECSREEALRRLCEIAGVPPPVVGPTANSPARTRPKRVRVSHADLDCLMAQDQLEWAKLRRYALETCLKTARRTCREGRMPVSEFYLKEQLYLEQLNEADEMVNFRNYQYNKLRKEQHDKDCQRKNQQ